MQKIYQLDTKYNFKKPSLTNICKITISKYDFMTVPIVYQIVVTRKNNDLNYFENYRL